MTLRLLRPWTTEWSSRSFRLELFATAIGMVVLLRFFTRFLVHVEARPGAVLNDPLLAMFPPVDLNWLTFTLIYGALLIGIASLAGHPRQLLFALQTYIVMVTIRMIAMYLTPLDPPATMIPLRDPTVEYIGTGVRLSKDLFFSGHTSTMLLLFLTAHHRVLRGIFLFCTIAVGCCVVLQHTHYAIDAFAAPFFAYAAYRIVLLAHGTRESAPVQSAGA